MSTMLTRFLRPIAHTSQLNFVKPHARISLGSLQSARTISSSTDPLQQEKPSHAHAHDKLWKAERYLSLGLLGVIPAAAVIPHPAMDYALATSLIVHVHWGVEAIVTDYIRPSIFGKVIPKVSIALVYVLSSLALGGLFVFNYTDVGLTQAIRMLAKL